MSANGWGEFFHLTCFGESHGLAMGCVIEGCPSGVKWSSEVLLSELKKRRPGLHPSHSSRNEEDEPVILSGVYENKTLGTPICIMINNKDQRSADYENLKPRRGHADQVMQNKYVHVDIRGGGRTSGRETVSRVIGGAVAQMFVKSVYENLEVKTKILQVGKLKNVQDEELSSFLIEAKEKGESYGGIVELKISSAPQGLGQPVFRKFKSDISQAMMSVGAVCGVELGDGFEMASQEGTRAHGIQKKDPYGGIQGGISTGSDIIFKIAFKPTSSVLDVARKGRHDPCIIPRALVVLEAMSWLVLADHVLWSRLDNL